ncbi:MAG: pyridoxamine 5'-phosphate oxidase family protein [Acidobacteriota bacterium]
MISEMTKDEAKNLLAQQNLGRLGCIAEGEAYVVPVHYHFDGEDIYLHSLPGRKLSALRTHNRACLQVDSIQDPWQWRSVIAYGQYQEIADPKLREQSLISILRHVPDMTPVESKMSTRGDEVVVFRLRLEQITGVSETW